MTDYPFNIPAAMDGLAALMRTIPGIQRVVVGGPEAAYNQVQGWVNIGEPEEVGSQVAGSFDLAINMIAWFGYDVNYVQEDAEYQLGTYMQELVRRLIRNRIYTVDGVTRNLNGSVQQLGLPRAASAGSDYAIFAGQELRTYPLGIRVMQRESIG